MKLPRRSFLHLTAGAAAVSAMSHIAGAQTYPSRSITMIVPFAAGGACRYACAHRGRAHEDLARPACRHRERDRSRWQHRRWSVARAFPDGYTVE